MYKIHIKLWRKIRFMSQKELAKKIGISQNYLSEIENQKFDIKLSLVIKICIALDISLNDLIDYWLS